MKLDTLFLSGGGINCISLLGVFKYLFENNIIQQNFKGIKNIVCVSGAAIYILPLLLGFSLDMTIKVCRSLDSKKIINYSEMDVNNIFNDFGLYDNDFIFHICSIILKNKGLSEKITMKELYEHTKINLVLKTTNITKYRIEYINHESDPELSMIDAIRMSSSIPLIFKPITYKNQLYVDGGLCGNYPIEYNKTLKSKNFLGINIKVKDKVEKVTDILSYISRLQMAPTSPYDSTEKKKKNTIFIIVDELGFNFDKTTEEHLEILLRGYIETQKFFTGS
tara:strand:- start:62 stop:898 length:837 start_codon:yes stop_codon:yes gene_type:complete